MNTFFARFETTDFFQERALDLETLNSEKGNPITNNTTGQDLLSLVIVRIYSTVHYSVFELRKYDMFVKHRFAGCSNIRLMPNCYRPQSLSSPGLNTEWSALFYELPLSAS